MKKSILTVLLSVLVSGLTAYAIVKNASPEISDRIVPADGSSYRTVSLEQTDYPDFTYAAESAVDAVVYVAVTVKTQVQQSQQYFDPFEFFFGMPGMGGGQQSQPRERVQQGSGSGVIIRPDGYIVTNNHVVSGATEVQVTLNNNKTYDATVIGTDEATDVALIKIDAEGLPTLELADSDALRLGEWVLAIGSPYNLRSTITAGIVSAKGRQMPNYNGDFKIESFIQTDAAVNPGNSGGALVNKAGELVGINTAIASTTGSYTGYSFAVPSNIVSKIVSDLIDFGSVKRVMLGITGGNVNSDIAKKFNLAKTEGVYVNAVTAGGTADKAGIRKDDIIIGIDDYKIASMSELQAKVNNFHPGDKAVIKVLRDGKQLDLNAEFSGTVDDTGTVAEDGTVAFYGAKLRTHEKGVEIVSAGNGKLAQAGGEDGFIIQYVNDQKVSKPEDVVNIAKKSKRSVFIEGVTAYGRPGYFGFGKE